MTQSALPNDDSGSAPIQPDMSKLPQGNTADIIRALTPILIAMIGGLIGIVVLLTNQGNNSAAFGVASTAIAGAAGLAQPNKDPKDK